MCIYGVGVENPEHVPWWRRQPTRLVPGAVVGFLVIVALDLVIQKYPVRRAVTDGATFFVLFNIYLVAWWALRRFRRARQQ